MKWRLFAAIGVLAAAQFVPARAVQAQEPVVANGPLTVVPLTLTATGRAHSYTVEVARTPVEQARGLMKRTKMGRDHGMIFPLQPPRTAEFWMEGTVMSLDIIFIGPDRKIRRIAANAVPFDRTGIGSNGPAAAVLELKAGEAARIGLKVGDAVSYTLD